MVLVAFIVYASMGTTAIACFGRPLELRGGEDLPIGLFLSTTLAVATWPIWTAPFLVAFVKDYYSRL